MNIEIKKSTSNGPTDTISLKLNIEDPDIESAELFEQYKKIWDVLENLDWRYRYYGTTYFNLAPVPRLGTEAFHQAPNNEIYKRNRISFLNTLITYFDFHTPKDQAIPALYQIFRRTSMGRYQERQESDGCTVYSEAYNLPFNYYIMNPFSTVDSFINASQLNARRVALNLTMNLSCLLSSAYDLWTTNLDIMAKTPMIFLNPDLVSTIVVRHSTIRETELHRKYTHAYATLTLMIAMVMREQYPEFSCESMYYADQFWSAMKAFGQSRHYEQTFHSFYNTARDTMKFHLPPLSVNMR